MDEKYVAVEDLKTHEEVRKRISDLKYEIKEINTVLSRGWHRSVDVAGDPGVKKALESVLNNKIEAEKELNAAEEKLASLKSGAEKAPVEAEGVQSNINFFERMGEQNRDDAGRKSIRPPPTNGGGKKSRRKKSRKSKRRKSKRQSKKKKTYKRRR